MKEIYEKIWKVARPYYEKGRPTDIEHIEWMMNEADTVADKENLDKSLLIPLVILHDVGYSGILSDNSFETNSRVLHMTVGAKISQKILQKLDYPKSKIGIISKYVSIHDNWALGDNNIFNDDKILGTFNDLDFMWMATPKGFSAVRKMLGETESQMIDFIKNDSKHELRPFVFDFTKNLYLNYIKDRKEKLIF